MEKEKTLKIMELSGRCLELVDCQVNEAQGNGEGLTHSDLTGAFMAIIMEAMQYGKAPASTPAQVERAQGKVWMK